MKLNGSLRVAVQRSGRLAEGSLALLKQMGLVFETFQDSLYTSCRNLPIDILFLRDDDIPEYVQDGVADLGIVGSNILDESGAKVQRVLPLDFGYCSLTIAVPERQACTSIQWLQGKRVATAYPRMLRKYLRRRNISVKYIALKGCVEIAPALNVADAICDVVSTGSTLRTHRLRVLDTVEHCQATLIGKKRTSLEKQELLSKLLTRAQGVMDAQRYKYVMFNLPKGDVEKVRDLVPGCKSPTVVPLADPEFVAVHSVVEEECFWSVVEKIRECGGSGILISPIEKFIR